MPRVSQTASRPPCHALPGPPAGHHATTLETPTGLAATTEGGPHGRRHHPDPAAAGPHTTPRRTQILPGHGRHPPSRRVDATPPSSSGRRSWRKTRTGAPPWAPRAKIRLRGRWIRPRGCRIRPRGHRNRPRRRQRTRRPARCAPAPIRRHHRRAPCRRPPRSGRASGLPLGQRRGGKGCRCKCSPKIRHEPSL
uniref:Uncharacterized protein n=1 Tax=Arundo donax TaxID=35708 RepID=A0A0A9GGI4_ARUDO